MLKRSIILLALAGGLLLGIGLPQTSIAQTNSFVTSHLSPEVIDQILEETAPQLGMTADEARAAYCIGALTITELGVSSLGIEVMVTTVEGGVDILTILEDIS